MNYRIGTISLLPPLFLSHVSRLRRVVGKTITTKTRHAYTHTHTHVRTHACTGLLERRGPTAIIANDDADARHFISRHVRPRPANLLAGLNKKKGKKKGKGKRNKEKKRIKFLVAYIIHRVPVARKFIYRVH